MRRGDADDSLDDAWVVASDSVLLGELLNGVTTLGGTAEHRRVPPASRRAKADRRAAGRRPPPDPHPEHLHQTLVWSPGQATVEECSAMARSTLRVVLRGRRRQGPGLPGQQQEQPGGRGAPGQRLRLRAVQVAGRPAGGRASGAARSSCATATTTRSRLRAAAG